MLVSPVAMLRQALEGQYAIAQFNINNLEWIRAILEAAAEKNAPVILGVTEAAARHMGGIAAVGALAGKFVDSFQARFPVALHLDHADQYLCLEAVGAGFSSVMFDGSRMPFVENLLISRSLADFCHKRNVALEAELGSPAGEEDNIRGTGERAAIAECEELGCCGIASLAPAIGNMHGEYPADWPGLDLDLLARIHAALPELPLVLHGGTGVSEDQIKSAIKNGICKINVNTECQIAFANALREYFEKGEDRKAKGYNLQKIMRYGMDAIRRKACEKIELFGSAGRAIKPV